MKGAPLPQMQSQTFIHGFLDNIFPVGLNPFYPDDVICAICYRCSLLLSWDTYESV